MSRERCDRCQEPRAVAYYRCQPTGRRLCWSCHTDEHMMGRASGEAGTCKTAPGPWVNFATVPGFPHFIQAARLLPEATG